MWERMDKGEHRFIAKGLIGVRIHRGELAWQCYCQSGMQWTSKSRNDGYDKATKKKTHLAATLSQGRGDDCFAKSRHCVRRGMINAPERNKAIDCCSVSQRNQEEAIYSPEDTQPNTSNQEGKPSSWKTLFTIEHSLEFTSQPPNEAGLTNRRRNAKSETTAKGDNSQSNLYQPRNNLNGE